MSPLPILRGTWMPISERISRATADGTCTDVRDDSSAGLSSTGHSASRAMYPWWTGTPSSAPRG